mgnify:FL=1
MAAFIERLRSIVGEKGIVQNKEMSGRSAGYSHPDRTLNAKVLIRPGTTDEVSRILKICDEQKQPVVCHGGLTGLVDGSIAGENEVILSLERMRKIEEIDTDSATMTVQAGVTLQTVQETAEEAGFFFPLDLGGRGSATLGGNISTNAGAVSYTHLTLPTSDLV